jgi:hypothetical protein
MGGQLPGQAQMQLQQLLGDRVQLPPGAVDALTEKTEASTSVDPAGSISLYMVLEL